MRVINTINRDRMALAKYIVIKITKVDLRRRRSPGIPIIWLAYMSAPWMFTDDN